MPRTTTPERRDNSILDAILSVQADTSEIKTTIAINSERIANINDHLAKLNGKVAAQEANGNSYKTIQDTQTRILQELVTKDEQRDANRSKLTWLTIENIFKAIFGIAIAYLLYKAGL